MAADEVNDYRAQFDKDAGTGVSLLGAAMLGANLAAPVWRVSFTCVDAPGGVNVTGDVAMVRNPGTARQDRMDMNSGKPAGEVQNLLDVVALITPRPAPADTSRK